MLYENDLKSMNETITHLHLFKLLRLKSYFCYFNPFNFAKQENIDLCISKYVYPIN